MRTLIALTTLLLGSALPLAAATYIGPGAGLGLLSALWALLVAVPAIGLTMIYRINPDQAFRQGVWVVGGLVLFALVVWFVRDHRILDSYKYLLGILAIGLIGLWYFL
jgi:cell division protein FtsW (lipid II flippase)